MNITSEAWDRPLYFLHLAKTGGTTFTSILDRQFAPHEICPAQLWHELLKIPAGQLSNYRCFRGHFYAYLERLIKRPVQYITFLRDPMERSLSHYADIARWPGHYFYDRVREQGSFLAFLKDPVTSSLLMNYQTRGLALDLDPVAIAATLSPEELDALRLEQILDTMLPRNMSDDELLARAKARLERCLFVGLTEHFEESLAHVARLLRWQAVPENIRLNVSEERPATPDLSPEAKALLFEQTYLDHELYAYARLRFERYRTIDP